MKPYGWRDELVVTLANLILRCGSKRQADAIKGLIGMGIKAGLEERRPE